MKQTFITIGAVFALLVTGCGWFGEKGVPKEQINADLESKPMKSQEGSISEWNFKGDDNRCFAVKEDDTKITETNADVTIIVASYKTSPIDQESLDTVFGKIQFKYKKQNDKWVLESVEPLDLMSKSITKESIETFVGIQVPLCSYFDQRKAK
jgi:hypothetical protein